MSATEELVREQLERIIGSIELRVEQIRTRANVLAPKGDGAKGAKEVRTGLVLMLQGLEKLGMLRTEFREPQPSRAGRRQVRGAGLT